IGKSTLAKILAGLLPATAGTATGTDGAVYIDQLLPHSPQRVDAALGIAEVRHALQRALHGDADDTDFDRIGDDWDIEERALAATADLGLHLELDDLDRRLSSFSGGQATRIGLARAALVGEAWLILDEPSNNLDEDGRALLTSLLSARRGPTLVISHDRTLLSHVDAIIEMTDRLRVYGGDFDDYEAMVAAEEAAKRQRIVDAKKSLEIERRQRIDLETKLARADRKAAKDKENKRRPKKVMNGLANFAEKSAAKRRGDKDSLRSSSSVRLDLPETTVHLSKRVLSLDSDCRCGPVEIVGPDRIRLPGPNGAGKSTLQAAIMAASGVPMRPGPPIDELFGRLAIRVSVPLAHLDQQYRLPEALTVMEAIRSGNPHLGPHRVHEVLAGMGLRAGRTEQRCGTLSGGERFRVALAAGLLSEPAPQLLILDEPGNNLDLSSLE